MIIPLSAGSGGGGFSFICRIVFTSSWATITLRWRLLLAGITCQGACSVDVAPSALW